MRRIVLVAACLALVSAACGKSESPGSLQGSQSSDAAGGCAASATAEPNRKPVITVPDCSPPKELVTLDVIAGTGAELTAGKTATVHYVGVSWSTKQQFDASWDGGDPFPTQIPGQVIQGWNEGLLGMKAGGRRLLTIPPDKAYGPNGQGPIGPNETLVFAVDLIKVS